MFEVIVQFMFGLFLGLAAGMLIGYYGALYTVKRKSYHHGK